MSCGICLSKLKEPVSLPCGHVYCTQCLTELVAASPDEFVAACAECREPFSIVRPELACLPKKFHQYILPSIRRVYIDLSRQDGLRKKLAASEARVRALEQDKERLMAECERHIAAAHAHGRGETDALLRAKGLAQELALTRENAAVDAEALHTLKGKYDKLKRRCRAYMNNDNDKSVEELLPGKRNSSVVDLSLDQDPVSPKRLRIIRPLPGRSRCSLGSSHNNPFSPKYSEMGGLGSPFH